MNHSWISAESDGGKDRPAPRPAPVVQPGGAGDFSSPRKFSFQQLPQNQLPEHDLPADLDLHAEAEEDPLAEFKTSEQIALEDDPLDRNPDLGAYRRRTIDLLRRYLRFSMETGRLPSVLGTSFFRSGVTSYSVVTFEDRVVFAHDMEICLERMPEFTRQVIARHILQEHNFWETARLLNCNEKTIRRMVPLAIDQLSEILLEAGVLETLVSPPKKTCQGGKNDEIAASDCEQGENKF